MPTQRTFVLLKPDAVRRGLVGDVLSRFEAKGLSIVALELRTIDAAPADEHYAEHVDRDFYPPLRDFVTSGPLIAAVLEGDEAVEVVRASTAPPTAARPRPGPSAATCRCRTGRTSCTARTHPSPRSARSRCGSPTCDPTCYCVRAGRVADTMTR